MATRHIATPVHTVSTTTISKLLVRGVIFLLSVYSATSSVAPHTWPWGAPSLRLSVRLLLRKIYSSCNHVPLLIITYTSFMAPGCSLKQIDMGGGGFLRVPFLQLNRTTGGTITTKVHTKYIVSKEHVEYTLSIDAILREMLNPLASSMFYPDGWHRQRIQFKENLHPS
jgi:hypothetical protein